MTNIRIRPYRDEDAEVAKEIFTLGMSEHVPSFFVHILKQPLTQMVLMCVFCALMASSRSFLLPVLAITFLLALIRLLVVYIFNDYIDTCLRNDLKNIGETYLKKKNSCFWVAENDEGHLVGTVACLPAEQPQWLELKRISVRRSYRGMGIAKKLCRTVADYTREQGYPAVVLYTSMLQTDAQKLYEHMGYLKTREFHPSGPVARICNFTLFEYILNFEQDERN